MSARRSSEDFLPFTFKNCMCVRVPMQGPNESILIVCVSVCVCAFRNLNQTNQNEPSLLLWLSWMWWLLHGCSTAVALLWLSWMVWWSRRQCVEKIKDVEGRRG